MKILKNTELDFNDVLIRPKSSNITSRESVDVTREYKFKWSGTVVRGVGIINANMGTIGNFNLARKMIDDNLFACLHKHHESNELYKFYNDILFWSRKRYKCFLSIGLRDDGINKIRGIKKRNCGTIPPICIDVPNGYISNVVDLVKKVRDEFPECILMVGNVVTGDMTKKLIKSGADIVKVGIGGGGQCMTRKQTGVGRPQLSTIIECAKAAHKVGGMVCSDGGITCTGDIVKAFGAGADFVMIGSLYAGTDEAEGDIIYEKEFTNIYTPDYYTYVGEGGILTEPTEKAEALPVFDEKKNRKEILRKYKLFYGMSSELAQEKFGNGKSWYTTSEGRVSLVPYTGSVHDMNNEFLGGLRSAMAYIGAKKLEDISKYCEFYRVNNQLNRTYESTTIGK